MAEMMVKGQGAKAQFIEKPLQGVLFRVTPWPTMAAEYPMRRSSPGFVI